MRQMQAKKIEAGFIGRIELELLSALFRYAVPLIGRKIDAKTQQREQKPYSLESVISNQTSIRLTAQLTELGLVNLLK